MEKCPHHTKPDNNKYDWQVTSLVVQVCPGWVAVSGILIVTATRPLGMWLIMEHHHYYQQSLQVWSI